MVNENQLEETSDSIQPIKNGLGISAEAFTEIVREFNRACLAKNIDKSEIERYITSKKPWRVKCITIGAISNILILTADADSLIALLNSLGEDIVTDEVIRASVDLQNAQPNSNRVRGKRSTNKIIPPKPENLISKPSSQSLSGAGIQRYNTKSNNKIIILSILGALGIIIVFATVLLRKGNKEPNKVVKEENQIDVVSGNTNQNIEKVEPAIEVKQVENELVTKNTTKLDAEKEKQKANIYKGSFVEPIGTAVYQAGLNEFIGGDMVMLSSVKKKKQTSPFLVGNRPISTEYVFIRFDIRNIPEKAMIENARIQINAMIQEDNEAIELFCWPLPKNWSFVTANYNREGNLSDMSFESFVKNKSAASKYKLNLRNDWVSFDVTKPIRDWVHKKSENFGFVIFMETKGSIVFDGFDSTRQLTSPKLTITFGESELATKAEEKPITKKELPRPNVPDIKESDVQKVVEHTAKEQTKEDDKQDNILMSNVTNKEEDKKEKGSSEKIKNVFEEDPDLNIEKEEKNKTNNASLTNNKEELESKNSKKTESTKEKQKETKLANIEAKIDFKIDVSMKDVVINPINRLIETKDTVKLENPEGNGEIRYTVDGREPTPDSLLYSEPFKLAGPFSTIKSAVFIDRVRKTNVLIHEYRIAGASGQVIDNTSISCKKIGNWESSKAKPNYYGSDYSWERKSTGTVEWVPSITKPSECEVYIWLPDGDESTRPKQAKYTIKYDGGTKEVFVDQTKRNNRWIYLGTYPMKGGSGSLVLHDDNSAKMFIADAAYFYFVND